MNKFEYLSSNEKTINMYLEKERSLHKRANRISSAEERGFNIQKLFALTLNHFFIKLFPMWYYSKK